MTILIIAARNFVSLSATTAVLLLFSVHNGGGFDKEVKSTVWTASDSNGRCWPPVIFTTKWNQQPHWHGASTNCSWWYDGVDPAHSAYVHVVERAAPNYTQTLTWLEDMTNIDWPFLCGPIHLVLDRATWHMHHAVVARFQQESDVKTYLLPGASGKWLNPQDQAIHALIRRKWRSLVTTTMSADHERHLIECCYAQAPAQI